MAIAGLFVPAIMNFEDGRAADQISSPEKSVTSELEPAGDLSLKPAQTNPAGVECT
jgi:hypothetical protein